MIYGSCSFERIYKTIQILAQYQSFREGRKNIVDDIDIIKLFLHRSQDAIIQTKLAYGKLLMSIAERYLKDSRDVEEVVDDTYMTVWNRIPPDSPVYFKAYICRILKNLSIKKCEYNSAGKRSSEYETVLDELNECVPDESSVEGQVLENELQGIINSFVRNLPADKRNIFIRRYWYLEPVQNIAKDLNISEKALSMRLIRMRKKLKTYLREVGYYD